MAGHSYQGTISTGKGVIEMSSPDPLTVSELKWLGTNFNQTLYDQFPQHIVRRIRVTVEYLKDNKEE